MTFLLTNIVIIMIIVRIYIYIHTFVYVSKFRVKKSISLDLQGRRLGGEFT